MNFDNLTTQKIRHAFVPADMMSITFVMEDGFRRSIGIANAGGTRLPLTSYEMPAGLEGERITSVGANLVNGWVKFLTNAGDITLDFPSGSNLVELPE